MAHGSFWAVDEDEQDRLRRERDRTIVARDLAQDNLADLTATLRPVMAEEARIKDALAETYDRGPGGRLLFNSAGAEARKAGFAGLLALSAKWGEARGQKSKLASMIKAYDRDIEKVTKILQSEQKRKQRKPRHA